MINYSPITKKICAVMILFASLLSAGSAFSQSIDLPKKEGMQFSIGAYAGLNDFHMKDEYLSPEPYRGIIFSSRLNLRLSSAASEHSLNFGFNIGNPTTQNSQIDISQKAAEISYSYLHSINTWNLFGSPFELSLGGGLSSFVMNTDYNAKSNFGTNYDQSWYWSHSLNIAACGNYRISDDQAILLRFSLPVYGIISRPSNGHLLDKRNSEIMHDNFLNAASGGKADFIWNNFVLFGSVEFKQKLGENVDLLVNYGFNYTSSNKPETLPLKSYMNNFLAGLRISL